MEALRDVESWPAQTVAVGVVAPDGIVAWHGDEGRELAWASVTKLATALATLVALEEGVVDLDEPAGPTGSTIRHLLAHASGLPLDGEAPISPPGARRIYSNTGFEAAADALAAGTGMAVGDYLAEAVLDPLGMTATTLRGSPAKDGWSDVADLARFTAELLAPTLVDPATLAEATREQFPGLAGVVPDLGRYDPNPWGLGFELKGAKAPHWTAPGGSPRTFGHFGGSGTFLWVDPDAAVGCVVLTDREFGDWAPPLWSAVSADVLAESTGSE